MHALVPRQVSWSIHAATHACRPPRRPPTTVWPNGVGCLAIYGRGLFFSRFFTLLLSGLSSSRGHRRRPSPPGTCRQYLPSTFLEHRIQQSPCSSIFHRVLLTYDLALSISQRVRKYYRPYVCMRVCTRGDSSSRN